MKTSARSSPLANRKRSPRWASCCKAPRAALDWSASHSRSRGPPSTASRSIGPNTRARSSWWISGPPGAGRAAQELVNIEKNYKAYHDRGFEVVGISIDRDRDTLDKYLEEEKHPWTILHDVKGAKSMATRYGVFSIPIVLLVGADGKVISINARGRDLGKELEKLAAQPRRARERRRKRPSRKRLRRTSRRRRPSARPSSGRCSRDARAEEVARVILTWCFT